MNLEEVRKAEHQAKTVGYTEPTQKEVEQVIESQSKTMMQLDDVSFAVLAFMRTYSRPDTNPGLIFENGKYLLGHLEALTLSMKQIVEKYESLR